MSTPFKLAGFALGLLAVFGASVGIGSAVGPVGPAAEEPAAHAMGADEPAATGDLPAKGLLVSQDGYSLSLADPAATAGPAVPVAFRILGPGGSAVTRFAESHDEDLHLIAVRRDLSGFQHVHPTLAADGTCPGTWRLFADFVPAADGENRTLGADLAVAGEYVPAPLPAASRTAEVDGYTVTLDGDLVPGEESELTLSVSRDGRPVTDLQPYLAAAGHVVVMRADGGTFAHEHAEVSDEAGRPVFALPGQQFGPDLDVHAEFRTAGTYRLWAQFRLADGDVITAPFTVEAR
jgi:hypothetical protein